MERNGFARALFFIVWGKKKTKKREKTITLFRKKITHKVNSKRFYIIRLEVVLPAA